MQKRALVRRPGPRLDEGLLTHLERVPVDTEKARHQWLGYVAALQAEGWELYEVGPADDCPDAVFVEDTAVVYGDLAIVTRPGADQRKPETTGTEEALRGLGYRIVAHRARPAPSTAATSSSTAARSGSGSADGPTRRASTSCAPTSSRWAPP